MRRDCSRSPPSLARRSAREAEAPVPAATSRSLPPTSSTRSASAVGVPSASTPSASRPGETGATTLRPSDSRGPERSPARGTARADQHLVAGRRPSPPAGGVASLVGGSRTAQRRDRDRIRGRHAAGQLPVVRCDGTPAVRRASPAGVRSAHPQRHPKGRQHAGHASAARAASAGAPAAPRS